MNIFAENAYEVPTTLAPGSLHNLLTIFLDPAGLIWRLTRHEYHPAAGHPPPKTPPAPAGHPNRPTA